MYYHYACIYMYIECKNRDYIYMYTSQLLIHSEAYTRDSERR